MSNNINSDYNTKIFYNYNYNNNLNDNNVSPFQSNRQDNVFNSNISNLPSFKFEIPSNFQSSQYQNNPNNKINKNEKEYAQLYKEEKAKELMNSQKKQRFMQNYENKIKDAKNTFIDSNNNNSEVFIDDYIRKIKDIHKDKNDYENFVHEKGFYNFSTCPFCRGPVIFFFERVFCLNKCFMTAVPSDTFDENYTLDNFMEQYQTYYLNHLSCKEDLITLYIDKESKIAEFLCSKCERNIFE
jgi:hypothetical protein